MLVACEGSRLIHPPWTLIGPARDAVGYGIITKIKQKLTVRIKYPLMGVYTDFFGFATNKSQI